MKPGKSHWEDDGRTVADMSGVERPNLFLARRPRSPESAPPREKRRDRPGETGGLSREERRWYMLGALRAALLIALCFIVVLGLAVLLMLLVWR